MRPSLGNIPFGNQKVTKFGAGKEAHAISVAAVATDVVRYTCNKLLRFYDAIRPKVPVIKTD